MNTNKDEECIQIYLRQVLYYLSVYLHQVWILFHHFLD